jgi:DNA-binding Lrp family transcriptional regulator
MDFMQLHLLNRFQRGFPLVPRPFAAVARQLGTDEDWVLDTLDQLTAAAKVARVGAVFAPNTVGASTLAALSVPEDRLDAVAARVSAHPSVTHNYARAHEWNLWFVASAADPASLDCALAEIRAAADSRPVLDLRLEEEYHIDLGFNLEGGMRRVSCAPFRPSLGPVALSPQERQLVDALASGLPLVARPFAAIGLRIGMPENALITGLKDWTARGVLRRFGVIVRHGSLGFRSNAMAVWDVPDADVTERGTALARIPGVTLCYRRRRALPDWPYNLFCMVHGQTAEEVDAELRIAIDQCELGKYPAAVLPTLSHYKQRGPTHWRAAESTHA